MSFEININNMSNNTNNANNHVDDPNNLNFFASSYGAFDSNVVVFGLVCCAVRC